MPLTQWMLRITAYAERLIEDLEDVDWPKPIKDMQRNWVGRSEGAEVDFPVRLGAGQETEIDPRLHDASRYAVWRDLHGTRARASAGRSDHHRRPVRRTWKGTATPPRPRATWTAPIWPRPRPASSPVRYATNPVNGQLIPVWIADYVLMGYGTGAIMAVPGHDQRDFEFAQAFNLPIVRVVASSAAEADAPLERAEAEPGVAVHSRNDDIALDGLPTDLAKSAITDWLEKRGLGKKTINYKLRDWLFSRQRYWGEPFPVVLDANDRTQAVAESELPVRLPELDDFKPTGKPDPPLSKATEWVRYSEKYQARDQYDAPVGWLVLVLSAVHRPAQRQAAVGPGKRAVLAAGGPLCRRGRARRAAPAYTVGSGTRCSLTGDSSARPSRFRNWSTRG